ncbi:tetratricopeptide repeat protein [Flavivirga eckloniae]|uniref:Uncharacterized protein n=1 Tax=Flavivirga eckloniae TaxID=1803846 RepID=A0A2K9PPF3_9FLAO|nr:tetratricopeptide repeat protein [Flavivirga eckloniae]AUP78953.1 hypothetical protein C1H87_09675 [Flavivirga eckloniae]
MKTNSYIDEIVQQGIELKNEDKFQQSIDVLEKVISNYPNYKKINGVMLLLAGNYYKLKLYERSIDYSFKVVANNPKVELANLLLYLSYFDLDEHEKAFMVLFSYLEKYPADLFKDTLEELLDGLIDGYSLNYEEDIISYAKKNDVDIPKGLLGGTNSN